MCEAGSQIQLENRQRGQEERDKDTERGGGAERKRRQKNTGGRFRLGGENFSGLAANQFMALPAATPRRPGNQQLNGPHYLKVTHIPYPHTHK